MSAAAPALDFWLLVPAVGLGFAAVYQLLPRVKPYPRWLGGAAAAAALLFGGFLLVRTQLVSVELLLFLAFSLVAVVSGGLLVLQRNPVHAALSFALVVLATCGLFLLQAAPFLMAATTIVYAGAIVVTFLFVIMLAQQEGPSDADYRSREPLFASAAGFLMLGTLLYVLQLNYGQRDVSELLARVRAAGQETTSAAIDAKFDAESFSNDLERLAARRGQRISEAVRDEFLKFQEHRDEWKQADDVSAMRGVLGHLEAAVGQNLVGLQPEKELPLSPYSGVRANASLRDAAQDREGRVALPATNVASLGQALFTDYLLSVELAGTLLLIATIGAIAIASRRTEGLR
jgi:NADH-quinone oxidoreductase subunit J